VPSACPDNTLDFFLFFYIDFFYFGTRSSFFIDFFILELVVVFFIDFVLF